MRLQLFFYDLKDEGPYKIVKKNFPAAKHRSNKCIDLYYFWHTLALAGHSL
jgi:hypothetical protein